MSPASRLVPVRLIRAGLSGVDRWMMPRLRPALTGTTAPPKRSIRVVSLSIWRVRGVVDDGEHGVAGGEDRFLFGAAPGDAPVGGAQEGVGAGSPSGDVAQGGGQPRVALVPAGVLLPTGRFVNPRAEFGPGHQVLGGGEAAGVDADLGDQLLGGGGADRGDLIELVDLRGERGDRLPDLGV